MGDTTRYRNTTKMIYITIIAVCLMGTAQAAAQAATISRGGPSEPESSLFGHRSVEGWQREKLAARLDPKRYAIKGLFMEGLSLSEINTRFADAQTTFATFGHNLTKLREAMSEWVVENDVDTALYTRFRNIFRVKEDYPNWRIDQSSFDPQNKILATLQFDEITDVYSDGKVTLKLEVIYPKAGSGRPVGLDIIFLNSSGASAAAESRNGGTTLATKMGLPSRDDVNDKTLQTLILVDAAGNAKMRFPLGETIVEHWEDQEFVRVENKLNRHDWMNLRATKSCSQTNTRLHNILHDLAFLHDVPAETRLLRHRSRSGGSMSSRFSTESIRVPKGKDTTTKCRCNIMR